MKRSAVWFAVTAGSWGSVILLAAILDCVLWRVSRDYIYAPREFLRQGLTMGAFMGTTFAAAATMLSDPLPSRRAVLRGVFWFYGITCGFALVAAGCSAVFSRPLTSASATEQLLPGRREAFCTGLIHGGRAGLIVGAVGAVVILVTDRRRQMHCEAEIGAE